MALTYRLSKGAPLTIEEVDHNFLELEQRLAALEKSERFSETIAQVKQEGDVLLFISTQGRTLGKAQIPRFPFQPKGLWTAKTAYQVGDVVNYQKQLLLCQKPGAKEIFDLQDWAVLLNV